MNNWEQYHQSTPKLLPPTVFEKTNHTTRDVANSDNNDNLFLINSGDNKNQFSSNSNESCLIASSNNNSHLVLLSYELEKLKNDIFKLHSENDLLRNKNKGLYF